MRIRNTKYEDINRLLEIYDYARKIQAENGNPNQWVNGYPSKELIENDISSNNSYVIEKDSRIIGTFVFIIGEDPTYRVIENGKWLNNEVYGTIHRIASSGEEKGLLKYCIDYCFSKCKNIRIDTHEDNHIMKHLLQKYGFVRCGIIKVADGSKRIAYQKEK